MPHHQQATRAGSRKKAAHGGARQPGQRRTSGGMCVMVPSESVSMREVTMLRARPKSARGRARAQGSAGGAAAGMPALCEGFEAASIGAVSFRVRLGLQAPRASCQGRTRDLGAEAVRRRRAALQHDVGCRARTPPRQRLDACTPCDLGGPT